VRPRPRVADALFRAGLFVLPFAVAFVYVVSMLPLMPIEQWRTIVGGMGLYLLAPVGTEVVVPVVVILLQEAGAATHVVVLGVASIALVDVFTALFFLWNWDLVERIPYLGRAVQRVEDRCRRIVETPSGMLNSIGLANIGVHNFIDEKLPYLRQVDTKVIVNIAASSLAGRSVASSGRNSDARR